jgi:hypothetical protein
MLAEIHVSFNEGFDAALRTRRRCWRVWRAAMRIEAS